MNRHTTFSWLKTGTLQKNEPYQTNVVHILLWVEAHSQVIGIGESKYILGGQDCCFYYMFITKFSGHNTIWWGTKIFGGSLSPNAPVATGLLEYVAIFAKYCSSFTWSDLNSKSFSRRYQAQISEPQRNILPSLPGTPKQR